MSDVLKLIELDELLGFEIKCDALVECSEQVTHVHTDGICLHLYCPTHIRVIQMIIQVARDSNSKIECYHCGRDDILPDECTVEKI